MQRVANSCALFCCAHCDIKLQNLHARQGKAKKELHIFVIQKIK